MALRAPGRVGLARRILLTISITLALVYATAIGYLMTQETRLVFAANRQLAPGRPADPFETVDLRRSEGGQFAWIMRHKQYSASAPWVLFLHGNAATVASRANIARYERLRALGLNVFAPEYRGFAGLAGEPTEGSVTADARAAYDYLRADLQVPAERLVIYGWSLGSAIGVNLASTAPSAAVILEGAPASLVAIGERQYPWMPVRLVMRNPFESILKVPRISAPMLFIHSPDDEIIPIEEGRRLYAAAAGQKTFVEVRGGHIRPADEDGDRMFGAVEEFLHRAGLLRN